VAMVLQPLELLCFGFFHQLKRHVLAFIWQGFEFWAWRKNGEIEQTYQGGQFWTCWNNQPVLAP